MQSYRIKLKPKMEPDQEYSRLTFQESMDLIQLPSADAGKTGVRKYMGTRAPWLPGNELPNVSLVVGSKKHGAAFGGNVYSQAALATCRALAEAEDKKGLVNSQRLGLHVSSFPFSLIFSTNTLKLNSSAIHDEHSGYSSGVTLFRFVEKDIHLTLLNSRQYTAILPPLAKWTALSSTPFRHSAPPKPSPLTL